MSDSSLSKSKAGKPALFESALSKALCREPKLSKNRLEDEAPSKIAHCSIAESLLSANTVRLSSKPFALWLDTQFRAPQQQVDIDELLLESIDNAQHQAVIRIWSNSPSLVVSRREQHWSGFTAAAERLKSLGHDMVLRRTGGTAVVHSPQVLNFTLCYHLPAASLFSVNASYRLLNRQLIRFLDSIGIAATEGEIAGAYCPGRFDIVSDGRKLAGTAQRVKRMASGQNVLSHLSLNVCNALSRQDELIDQYYADCGQTVEITPDLTTSVNNLIADEKRYASGLTLGAQWADFLTTAQ